MPGQPGALELPAADVFAVKLERYALWLAFVVEGQVDVDLLLSQRTDEVEHIAIGCLGTFDCPGDLRDHLVLQREVIITDRGLEFCVRDRDAPRVLGLRCFGEAEAVFDAGN